jgi:hypothetical protein
MAAAKLTVKTALWGLNFRSKEWDGPLLARYDRLNVPTTKELKGRPVQNRDIKPQTVNGASGYKATKG